jgi:menaquinone-dependent protoporphyrinogen oxidase
MTDSPGPHPDTHVLVAAGSKHGATTEIAQRVADTLRARGLDVTMTSPESVRTVDGYDAVVLGSAVYAGRWLDDAKALADRLGAADPVPAVWLFSSGPVGDPPKPEEDPVDVSDIIHATSAREHRVFAGRIDKSTLSFGERAIMMAVRAREGDYRDWDEITAWAGGIADALASRNASA